VSHQAVDGTLVVAQLKRNLLGGAVYKDVTVREADGNHRNLGTILVLNDMRHAMAPGSRGRFYFYDVLGSKGIHAFRPKGGTAHMHFPYRWDIMSWGLGVLNLMVAMAWYMLDGRIPYWTTTFGVLGIVLGVVFLTTRLSATKAYRADEGYSSAPDELSQPASVAA
jgi:hypothetical protein